MKREIVDALIASLNDPDAGWEYNHYVATNLRIKCEIWLANGPDQMNVRFWGDKIAPAPGPWDAQVKYDGCCLGGYFMPWRWRLWWVAVGKQQEATAKPAIPTETIVAAIRSASQAPA